MSDSDTLVAGGGYENQVYRRSHELACQVVERLSDLSFFTLST